jgi:hypothetical protein
MQAYYAWLADGLTFVHLLYVAFVVLGEVAVLVGAAFGRSWVRNPWFRYLHLLAIGIVAVEGLIHVECPLTVWERELRTLAGQETSYDTFTGWLVHVLMCDNLCEQWIYDYLHVGFGVLVLGTMICLPPQPLVPRLRRQPTTA